MAAEGRVRSGPAAGDLARLRAIAEEGRRRPLLGGPALIVWGIAIAMGALFNYAALSRTLVVPGWSISLAWFALTTGAAIVAGALQPGYGARDAALSTANRVSRSVWLMAGAFLGTLAVGLVIHSIYLTRGGSDHAFDMLAVMGPVTFGVYGIALAATAVAGETHWLLRYAWGSLALTVVTAVLLGQSAQHLVTAAGAVAVSVLPGIRLLRAARNG